ncbi:Uncharacterised protein [Mycobacteroides abscessus]|nr:Uncharacterised protein [Mycobacteroides abscessus]
MQHMLKNMDMTVTEKHMKVCIKIDSQDKKYI